VPLRAEPSDVPTFTVTPLARPPLRVTVTCTVALLSRVL
jgi:hypothetical protein